MVAVADRAEAVGRPRRWGGVLSVLFAPVTVAVLLFAMPMAAMVQLSLVRFPPDTASGYTLDHYVNVLTSPLTWRIAATTAFIATTAMIIMLAIAIPLAYFMAFRAGRWELILLLFLVLADELSPVVRIYAWQVILGREGIVNWLLQVVGITSEPVDWLLFGKFAVVVTLAATFITYTTIPIWAAMKAIDPSMMESAVDLGAGWWTKARRIVIPLAAPGIFISMILVYVPMFTDFVTSNVVGGTGSYMLGQWGSDLILQAADWGSGSALNFLLLAVSAIASVIAYRLARLNRIQQ